jgi:hypothetical protein
LLRRWLEGDSDLRRFRAGIGLGVVIMSGRMPAAINSTSMVKETIGTPNGVPSLVVAPVRAAATDCRHDWWRKNHRNEGQGKKQVNHEGNSLMLAAAHSCKAVSLNGQ